MNYRAKNTAFLTRTPPNISAIGTTLGVYEQLPHARFPLAFKSLAIAEFNSQINPELNELQWSYQSPPSSIDYTEPEDSRSNGTANPSSNHKS